jgi:uncharacterized protein (TIGR03435 family)
MKAQRFLIVLTTALLGQAQPSDPAFEVVSIKPAHISDEQRTPFRNRQTPAGLDYLAIDTVSLIRKAFGIDDYQLQMPKGFRSQEWTIMAKAPAGSQMQDFPAMIRTMLVQRFKLAFHRENRPMQVFELVIAKGGFKLKDVGPPAGGMGIGRNDWKGRVPISLLAETLTLSEHTPVLDKTGLSGIYQIQFDYTRPTPAPDVPSAPGPNLSEAMEQAIGLKLQPAKASIEVLVVDRVELPTEN